MRDLVVVVHEPSGERLAHQGPEEEHGKANAERLVFQCLGHGTHLPEKLVMVIRARPTAIIPSHKKNCVFKT